MVAMNNKAFIVYAVILVVGIWVGFAFSRIPSPTPTDSVANVASATIDSAAISRTFLDLAVNANLGKHFIVNFLPLKQSMEDIQKKYAQTTYIYFDYLNNASYIGLGSSKSFTAASTVKVPLAMAIYKLAEDGKLDLNANYSLQDTDLDARFGELYKVGADQSFSVEELLKIMLENSDNTAMNALYKVLQSNGITDPFQDVYSFLGWTNFSDFGQDNSAIYKDINLKTLSNMFIALYNAQYISAEHSNEILKFLSSSSFNNKIVAGVPAGIPVSHKEGIYTPNNTYSDCGIVYIPNRSYLLCMAFSGGDEAGANRFMSEISKSTYDFVATH
jgi:beta-lactamase class A